MDDHLRMPFEKFYISLWTLISLKSLISAFLVRMKEENLSCQSLCLLS